MRESRPLGSVRGASGDRRLYSTTFRTVLDLEGLELKARPRCSLRCDGPQAESRGMGIPHCQDSCVCRSNAAAVGRKLTGQHEKLPK